MDGYTVFSARRRAWPPTCRLWVTSSLLMQDTRAHISSSRTSWDRLSHWRGCKMIEAVGGYNGFPGVMTLNPWNTTAQIELSLSPEYERRASQPQEGSSSGPSERDHLVY